MLTDTVIIRNARRSDIDAIMKIEYESFLPGLREEKDLYLKRIDAFADGFLIAEEDLTLRGAGEVLGTRQSGLEEFKIADLSVHGDLLKTARNDAKYIVNIDPELQTQRGCALRLRLYLFRKDEAVKTLRSG